jgi:hypothetical protein
MILFSGVYFSFTMFRTRVSYYKVFTLISL